MSKENRFSSGFFWGAVIGGAIALLLAPSTGKELRRRLTECTHCGPAHDIAETTEDLIAKTKESIETNFEKLNKIVDEKKHTSSSKIDEALSSKE